MAQLHELDQVEYVGDWVDDLGKGSGMGKDVAASIMRERIHLGIDHPETLLCLGAGQAYPELELADTLTIPHANVTLLDRGFTSEARDRIARVAPGATIIEDGLFTYMQGANGKRFSLVTGFGLESVLLTERSLNEFFRLLPGVLDDSALVFTKHLFTGNKILEAAARHGFALVSGSEYLFTPVPVSGL